MLEDSGADVAVSVATLWELSIKLAKGALLFRSGKPVAGSDYFARQAGIAGFTLLSIDSPEAEYVRHLPKIHNDPFDRLLIAQALLGARTIMTRDGVFADYPGVQTFVPTA